MSFVVGTRIELTREIPLEQKVGNVAEGVRGTLLKQRDVNSFIAEFDSGDIDIVYDDEMRAISTLELLAECAEDQAK